MASGRAHLRSRGSACGRPRSRPCGGSPRFCVVAGLSLAPAAAGTTPGSYGCWSGGGGRGTFTAGQSEHHARASICTSFILDAVQPYCFLKQ